jgi:cytochrome c peroxidase
MPLFSDKFSMRRFVRAAVLVAAGAPFAVACGRAQTRSDRQDVVHDLVVPVPTANAQHSVTAQALRNLASGRTDSLKHVHIPDTPDLERFVKNRDAVVRLGKSLFWDQQVGSDGQACGSCHFHAGADNRSKNQLDPGLRNQTPETDPKAFNDRTAFGPNLNDFGPNYTLKADDFPFHKLSDPFDKDSAVISDTNDVASSQGVFSALFQATGIPNDIGIPSLEGNGAVFDIDGVLTRNVETRQTPTVINARFNHRNFWDGRARFEFNGVTPFGKLDPNQRVVEGTETGEPMLVKVRVEQSSLASQAVGPIVSDQESSFGSLPSTFGGRTFPDVGRKMLAAPVVPLGQQLVSPEDSVLGGLSLAPADGINARYAPMVQEAFQDRWWNIPGFIVDLSSPERGPELKAQSTPTESHEFTVMEYNFSLFFGLAVQEYEKTLVSDDAPFDRFMEGNDSALSPVEQEGFRIFLDKGKCINCHGGAAFTNASLENNRQNDLIERMIMGDDRVAVYDEGFYNIGVRPTLEDIGVGGVIGPLNLPLSNSRLFQMDLAEAVSQIEKDQPSLSKDDAIRLANKLAGIPRIPARPAEAELLLKKAAPEAATKLAAAKDTLASAIGPLNRLNATDWFSMARLGAIQTQLAQATVALAVGKPNDAAGILVATAAMMDRLAAQLGTSVDAQTNEARDLLAPGLSLLPDPIDPGPDPAKPFGPPLRPDERVAVDGAFKVPSLRNVSETAPFFHNGGQATLEQVVLFYNRGGDFPKVNRLNLDPDIQPLGLTDDERAALVAFLRALTDERVHFERAPFDHPAISVPNGGTTPVITPIFPDTPVFEDRFTSPVVGAKGNGVGLGIPNTPLGHFLQPLQ